MTTSWAEVAAREFEEVTRNTWTPDPRWTTPGALARAIDPNVRQTPALDLIDSALVDVEAGRCDRLIVSMPPQEGKSSRVTTVGPLWFLARNPDRRIAIVSYAQSLAQGFGRDIRTYITNNSGDEGTLDLNLRIAADNGSAGQWQIAGRRGGVRSVGMSGGLTGRAADALFIDDPISNREQADSKVFRDRHWQWWNTVGSTRLAPRAPVILVLTRWHEDDLAGRLLNAEDGHRWRNIAIPAQADSPDDPLGRELGEFMDSARWWRDPETLIEYPRNREEWEAIKVSKDTRSWTALYQQRPAPVDGAVWKSPWIENNRGKTGEMYGKLAKIVVSIDPAATSKKTSDMTGIVVTGIDREGTGWVLDDRTMKGTPLEWATAAWNAVLDWNADEVIIENNQGGEMVLEVMRSAWNHIHKEKPATRMAPRVTPVHASQSKRTRAESIAALYETGKVKHAADGTGRLTLLEGQMLTWTGTGDSPDRIDALVHGLTVLFLPQHSDGGVASRPTHQRWAGMRGR